MWKAKCPETIELGKWPGIPNRKHQNEIDNVRLVLQGGNERASIELIKK